MKIVHLMLGCFYIDNHSYQENMLPKYHKELGHDVEIIASTLSFDKNGDACNVEARRYVNEYGILVTRLPYKKLLNKQFERKIGKFFRIYDGFQRTLEKSNPDILFIHGCQFCDINIVVNYLKKHDVKVYVDNHADFSNSARNWFSKRILHGIMWKWCAKSIEPYTTKFYGVLPARVDFLKNVYNIPADKVELLVMGADDEMVKKVTTIDNKKNIRKSLGIGENDFVIITGGKIDHAKRQVVTLLKILSKKVADSIHVIVFGSIVDDMKEEVMSFVDNKKIHYVGWLQNEQTARHIAASDLAVYPGRHSVLWEETVGLGIPMIVKEWEGTRHIDVGGNVIFLSNDSEAELSSAIEKALDKNIYANMKKVSDENGMKFFSYKEIAKKSIDII